MVQTEEKQYTFERVQEFTYLGVKIREDSQERAETEARRTKGNQNVWDVKSTNKNEFRMKKNQGESL